MDLQNPVKYVTMLVIKNVTIHYDSALLNQFIVLIFFHVFFLQAFPSLWNIVMKAFRIIEIDQL